MSVLKSRAILIRSPRGWSNDRKISAGSLPVVNHYPQPSKLDLISMLIARVIYARISARHRKKKRSNKPNVIAQSKYTVLAATTGRNTCCPWYHSNGLRGEDLRRVVYDRVPAVPWPASSKSLRQPSRNRYEPIGVHAWTDQSSLLFLSSAIGATFLLLHTPDQRRSLRRTYPSFLPSILRVNILFWNFYLVGVFPLSVK